eukprot:465398-Hanusia_phi.AAC.3
MVCCTSAPSLTRGSPRRGTWKSSLPLPPIGERLPRAFSASQSSCSNVFEISQAELDFAMKPGVTSGSVSPTLISDLFRSTIASSESLVSAIARTCGSLSSTTFRVH